MLVTKKYDLCRSFTSYDKNYVNFCNFLYTIIESIYGTTYMTLQDILVQHRQTTLNAIHAGLHGYERKICPLLLVTKFVQPQAHSEDFKNKQKKD
jgi:hypothetical protein